MIVALVGKKRSGKDTVANVLVNEYGFVRYGLADPIKVVVKYLFDWNEEHTNGNLKETIDSKWGISPRQAMQWLGTEAMQLSICQIFPEFEKVIGRRFWVRKFVFMYEEQARETGKYLDYVISDVRFPHEIYELDQNHRDIIVVKIARTMNDLVDTHESEKYIDSIKPNVVLDNNGTIEDLIKGTKTIMESLKDETIFRPL
jgi:hypothetical protein